MRLKIKFVTKAGLVLPIHYNEIIQGFIYKNLHPEVAKKVHDEGFKDPETGKIFKFFTFSRLIPENKPVINKNSIIFKSSVNLIVSSIYKDFIKSLVENLLSKNSISLENQEILINSLEILPLPEYKEKIRVRTLSPITVYTTFNENNKKKTYYYNPKEKDFCERLLENLKDKVRIWYGETISEGEIKFIKLTYKKERIVMYKNTIIKGWDGVFELKLPKELFEMAFLTGLGAKNSAGFGCIEVC
jgi:CRISPR-associated endoribonuclease Cas6